MKGCVVLIVINCVQDCRTYHGEIMKSIAPRDLQDHIGPNEIVASIHHANIALATADINELQPRLAIS